MAMTAAFALCVRSTARTLPGVLNNLEALAGLYERCAFVFVEGDSADESKSLLKAWAAGRSDTTAIELDGLEARLPLRSERLAACRNAYIEVLKRPPLAAFDQLVVLDADEINQGPIDLEGFARARDWLAEQGAGGVFANSQPFYYDIWALRHPQWCPQDFLDDIRRERDQLGKAAAQQRFIYDRQIQIPKTADPIEVRSAFGGLAIYRMADALGARYAGLTQAGREICEHVSFNQDLGRSGRGLYILPWLTIGAAQAGVTLPADRRTLILTQGDRSCELIAPANYKVGDRDLPALARWIGVEAPGTTAIDVGAGIGESIARLWLQGADLRFIAVEESLARLKFLVANLAALPDLLGGVEAVWRTVGRADPTSAAPGYLSPRQTTLEELVSTRGVPPERLSLLMLNTKASLAVIRDESAYLERAQPVVWIREAVWAPTDFASGAWPYRAAIDGGGLALIPERFAAALAALSISSPGRAAEA